MLFMDIHMYIIKCETWLRQTHQLHPHDSLQRGREERSSYGTSIILVTLYFFTKIGKDH